MMNRRNRNIYQVKVTLLPVPEGWPRVWRRLQVPADLTLDRFHDVLQISMGWEDSHLHEFRIRGQRFGPPDFEERCGKDSPKDERLVRLDQVLSKPGSRLMYIYDFGDYWTHELLLEQVVPKEDGQPSLICIEGRGQCPPEDCGGIEGYLDILRASEDRDFPGGKEIRRWLGGNFDPTRFAVDQVNRQLLTIEPRVRRVGVNR